MFTCGVSSHIAVSFCSISDIKHVLEEQMLSRGDKIVEFGEDLTFVCFGYDTDFIIIIND